MNGYQFGYQRVSGGVRYRLLCLVEVSERLGGSPAS